MEGEEPSDVSGGEAEWGGSFDPFSDPEEKRVLFAALDSFYQYRKIAHYNMTHRRRQAFYALPSAHWQFLAAPPISYLDTLSAIDDAIDANGLIATAILKSALESFGLPPVESLNSKTFPQTMDWRGTSTPADLSKAHTIIRQFYRDWSAEGQSERDNSYGPVLDDLVNEFGSKRSTKKILVPGAGLGRLVFEVCKLGFNSEGNEISYHALFASSWVLNHSPAGDEKMDLFPWLNGFANQVSRKHQIQRVKIPDVHPETELRAASELDCEAPHAFERLSMSAADFSVVYNDDEHKNAYDGIVTVFFLDTAPNLIAYVQAIKNCLKDGGVWINLGPLLWHFGSEESEPGGSQDVESQEEGTATGLRRLKPSSLSEGSVELSNEEVLALVEANGFSVEKQEIRSGEQSAGYINHPESMLQSTYRVAHWVARKMQAAS
ncbi:MAG: hypothetical protein M4579_006090 [Chaenotheca gracillima]|nr:MAG: hypothetical protein M4579_006090 [Chaenotheca gracillima]